MRRLAISLWLSCCALTAQAGPAASIRVILVGDSTMATRTGYGDALCGRFLAGVSCVNLARGGRSSGSFRAEGRWDEVQTLLRDGAFRANYVLVQFGHNDQPGKPGRSTDLVHEFPHNMARYAAEVKALDGVPVLVTPLTRRAFDGPWLHDDLAPWSAQTRRVAAAGKTSLLDLNALSAAAVQAMGSAEADTLAAAPPLAAAVAPTAASTEPQGTPKSVFDHTHVGAKGAVLFSGIVANELARIRPELAASLRQP
jgi:lysophospholipase L1-like esterase